jgi:biopolymer transport protein ExbD
MAVQIDTGEGAKKKVRPEMNITPLIDVVLVLLIIFMVVTPLMIKQLWVNTPKPVQNDSAQPDDPETPAVLAVDAQGKVTLNHEPIEATALPAALRASLQGKKDKTVFFSAHDDAPYGAAVDVMDVARGAGASSIAVATQKADPAPLRFAYSLSFFVAPEHRRAPPGARRRVTLPAPSPAFTQPARTPPRAPTPMLSTRPRTLAPMACAVALASGQASAQPAPAPAPPPAAAPAPAPPPAAASAPPAPPPAAAPARSPDAADAPSAPASPPSSGRGAGGEGTAPPAGEEGVEEMQVEEGAAEELGTEMPKPDAKSGVITGVVLDGRTGEAVPDAQIVVVGTKHRAVADFEGNYGVKLPPGRYSVRIFFPGFKAKRVDNVAVVAGKVATVKVSLGGDEKAAQVEELVVETEAERATAATQLLIRRKSSTVSDAIGAQDIAKTPDRNAAEAARRVVGATVVDGRFVYVRGLGDRYTNSLLNGVPVPSPEPDTQALPLDIFPVLVLSDITISKTFTPDMPADFAGGSVNIHTRSFPEKFTFSISATGGVNAQSTFRGVDTYRGGNTDWLGADDGSRALPRSFPPGRKASVGPDGQPVPLEQQAALAAPLSQSARRVGTRAAAPNHTLSAFAGDRFNLFNVPVGWMVGATYGHRYRLYEPEIQRTFVGNSETGEVRPLTDFRGRRSIDSVTLGALGGLSAQFDRNNRATFHGLVTRNSDDEVWRAYGHVDEDSNHQLVQRVRWVERALTFGQLGFEHRVPSLNGLEINYSGFYAKASRDEPNNTQSIYAGDPATGRLSLNNDNGLTHFFSQQRDTSFGGTLNVTAPLDARDPSGGPKLKAGGLVQVRDRQFAARRFELFTVRCAECADTYALPPYELARNYVGRTLRFDETTQDKDFYEAGQNVYAGYLMGDWPVTKKLRLIGGERVEYGAYDVSVVNAFAVPPKIDRYRFSNTDLLPSLSAVYALTDRVNLRGAAAQTLARPQLREISPFRYQESAGQFVREGNPALRRSRITNVDARWEWFPASGEVVAASVFYKHFADPIEATILGSAGDQTRSLANAKSADNVGFELEARKGLEFLAPGLKPFSFLGNFTYTHSRITVPADQELTQNEKSRALQGQAPWVVNAALEYASPFGTRVRALYYVFGRRLDAIALKPTPNIYEESRHVFDVTVSQSVNQYLDVKLSAENVFNAPFRFTQGGQYTSRYTLGSTYWATLTYAL